MMEPRAQGWVKRGVPERPRDTCDPQGSGGDGAAIRLVRETIVQGTGSVVPFAWGFITLEHRDIEGAKACRGER